MENQETEFKDPSLEITPWNFVERFYPRYYQSDEIAYSDDLSKIVSGEEERGDCASRVLREDFNYNRKKAARALIESEHEIYEQAMIGFLEQEKAAERKRELEIEYRVLNEVLDYFPKVTTHRAFIYIDQRIDQIIQELDI